ncbi:hypothetical protein C8R48DRAFT_692877 [Suillus tomentosus]|nr:hypothetical protein C8R48DRAFT_692877 [Suillus tomentosus]
MKSLMMTETTKVETRLAGTFFFSRNHTQRSTAGHFFVTLAYQLGINFPSVKNDVSRAIRDNPAVLDSSKSLRTQMITLFRQTLWRLKSNLRECPPPVCKSASDLRVRRGGETAGGCTSAKELDSY